MPTLTPEQEARFWAKVDKRGPDDCWPWTAYCTIRGGYGRIKIARKQYIASRIAWELAHGKIPEGLHVLHQCDNPPCCNPGHLFLGTPSDNTQDMHNKKRHQIEKRKLDLDQAREMRRLSALGVSGKKLTQRFGVAKGTVSMVLSNQIWKE